MGKRDRDALRTISWVLNVIICLAFWFPAHTNYWLLSQLFSLDRKGWEKVVPTSAWWRVPQSSIDRNCAFFSCIVLILLPKHTLCPLFFPTPKCFDVHRRLAKKRISRSRNQQKCRRYSKRTLSARECRRARSASLLTETASNPTPRPKLWN